MEAPGSGGASSPSGGATGAAGTGASPAAGTGGGDTVSPGDDDDDNGNGDGNGGGSGGSTGSGGGMATGGSGGTTVEPPGPLSGSATLDPSSCDLSIDFAVSNVTDDDGNEVGDPSCVWSFSDGGTSSSCAGTHAFATAGAHAASVVVSHPATGATGTLSTNTIQVYEPLSVSIEAQAPACGLLFSYAATETGGTEGWGDFRVTIDPRRSVLGSPPWPTSGTFAVSDEGTYEIEVEVRQERGSTTCTAEASAEVVVRQCLPLP